MPQLAQIETAQIKLERPQLEQRKKELEESLESCETRKQMGYMVFLGLFVLGLAINNTESRLALWGLVVLAGFGYHAYVPQDLIDLNTELKQVKEYLKLFEQRDRKQAKKEERQKKKEAQKLEQKNKKK
jgi:hypothetical protein